MIRVLFAWLLVSLSPLALAVIETYEFATPDLEARYHELAAELRCPKCQNQNIADSNAPIAQDLRAQLHRQLEGGASDQQIKDYMVQRYGEFVLYRPRFDGKTALLWLAPALLLVLALFFLLRTVGGQRQSVSEEPQLSAEERERLQQLLSDGES